MPYKNGGTHRRYNMTFSVPNGYTTEEARRVMALGWGISFSDEPDISIYKRKCCGSCHECVSGHDVITSCPLCGSDLEPHPYVKECKCGVRLRWCRYRGRPAVTAFGIPFELMYGITDEEDVI